MISITKILYIYIIVSIIFTETYVFFPWMQSITIMNYVLLFTYLLYRRRIHDKNIIQLQMIIFIFIGYIFFIDLIQNDMRRAFSSLVTTLPIPFILGIFSLSPDKNKLIFFFAKFYVIYNLIFSILQLVGIYITSGLIISKVPVFGIYRGFVGLSLTQGLRISGAGSSTIGLACTLGIIFILFYFYKDNDKLLKAKERKIYLIIIFALILLTQTRSLIFSLPIVIIFTNIIVSKQKLKSLITTFLGVVIFIIIIYFSFPFLMEKFPRLFLEINQDGSVIHRLQANVYGVIGTFHLSPWIGVPFADALKAMNDGYNTIGLFIGNYYINEVTYHNQLAYYFRHYGFIGLGMLFILIYKMFKVALDPLKTEQNQKILFAVILFYFLYTLSHNNKWTMDYFLWMFMALNLHERVRK